MQVQPVNNQCFGQLYWSRKIPTIVQEGIKEKMVNELRTNMPNLNGKTLEHYYEKKGYDFVLEPCKNDFVLLKARVNTKNISMDICVNKYSENSVKNIQDDLKRILI